jgi:cellulose synthase/poly-beta-1,6-N-acetylglucosamine synthase-like glycosyltransferase
METLFFILVFATIYSYLIYPLVLLFLKAGFSKPWLQSDINPSITIVISAHNEEAVIAKKIQNSFGLDYPRDLLKIIVTSDGSTDRTDEIVSEIQDKRLELRSSPDRAGKTTGLNRIIPYVSGDIVLFTDANAMFPRDMLLKLARNFASEDVDLVTGWTKYTVPGKSDEETTGIYSRLEKWTKYCESIISSCIGADGAVFAIRRRHFKPLDPVDINDFVVPLHVIAQGKRAVLDPEVFCSEEASEGVIKNYRRQVRITIGTLWGMQRNIHMLNIFKYGFSSFFFFSHKLMRLLVPFFFIFGLGVNIYIFNNSPFYIMTLLLYGLFLIVGGLNLIGLLKGRIAEISKIFMITMAAQMIGWLRTIKGDKDTIWAPQR